MGKRKVVLTLDEKVYRSVISLCEQADIPLPIFCRERVYDEELALRRLSKEIARELECGEL